MAQGKDSTKGKGKAKAKAKHKALAKPLAKVEGNGKGKGKADIKIVKYGGTMHNAQCNGQWCFLLLLVTCPLSH